MLFLKELLCLLLCGWLLVSTHRRLVRGAFGRAWLVWFVVLCCAGIALGVRLICVTYLVSPTSRAHGFPFAIAGGELFGGRWVDGGVGRYMPFPFLADLAFGVVVCLAPFAVLSFFYAPKIQRASDSA
jgi:hypothetical protein